MPNIAIVGAGIIGLWCAYELGRRGARVTVIDKGTPGDGCSSGNTGWIVPSFSGPIAAPGLVGTSLRWMLSRDSPLYIRPAAMPRLAGWLLRFRRHCNARDYQRGLKAVAELGRPTMALFDALRADGVPFEMHHQGVLFVVLTRRTMDHVRADLDRMQPYGYAPPNVLSGDEVRDLEPTLRTEVAGGVLVEEERHVRPETLVAGLVRRLDELGVTVRAGVEVTGARRRGRAVVALSTAGMGEIEADHFLLAAGAWSGEVGRRFGLRLPVQAGKGYSITLHDPALALHRALYLDEAKVACSAFQGGLRLAGTMELSGVNDTVDTRRIDAIRRGADRYFTRWHHGERETVWMGMRPLTPDGLPVIGPAPGCENLFVATGHAMLGVTLAPATARVLADLILGQEVGVDLAPFAPGRFAGAG
ncbi:MAG: FAD-dependent oxidoreductase [Armatimonadetes bacterium]|nr:FAD-dependent oxidoreductase [Armatimonadota bacterium]